MQGLPILYREGELAIMSRGKTIGVGETVGLILTLIGTGVQLRWPDQKWLGTACIALGVAVMLGVVLWYVAQHYARKEFSTSDPPARQSTQRLTQSGINFKPENVFKPTVNVSVPVTQKQSHRQPETPKSPSVFEATDNARIVNYGFDSRTGHLIREPYYEKEEDLPNHVAIINVALAQFHYRHDAGVESSLNVSAHLFPYDSDRKPLKPSIYHAVWDNADLDRQIPFSAGKAHDLIVALIRTENPEGIVLYEHATERISYDYSYGTEEVVRPKIQEVKGKVFLIKIELAPTRWNNPLPKQPFWFRLSLEPEPVIVKIRPSGPRSG